MSLFGLHRRWRGAALGHLACVEMTSSEPSRRYSAGLRRLGFDERTTVFYDEHVEADAVHEQIASVDMCGSLVADEPELLPDVLFGAACSLAMDGVAAATPARRLGGRPQPRCTACRPWPPDRSPGRRSSPAARRICAAGRGRLGALGAENPDRLCVPSQKGLMPDFPQRHSAIVLPARVDLGAVLVEQPEVAADDQRAVPVGRDGGAGSGAAARCRRPRAARARAVGGSRPSRCPAAPRRHTRDHPDGFHLTAAVDARPSSARPCRRVAGAGDGICDGCSASGSWRRSGRPTAARGCLRLPDRLLGDQRRAERPDGGEGQRRTDQRSDDEQPDVRERARRRRTAPGPSERAGFTDVPSSGMPIRWTAVSARPIARPAKPGVAERPVTSRITRHEHEGEHDLEDERPAAG